MSEKLEERIRLLECKYNSILRGVDLRVGELDKNRTYVFRTGRLTLPTMDRLKEQLNKHEIKAIIVEGDDLEVCRVKNEII